MPLTEHDRTMAQAFRERLAPLLGPRLRALKVFGSRATGRARPSSDLDVFVLVEEYDRQLRRDILHLADDLTIEYDFQPILSPLVMGVAEYESMRAHERRLVRDIDTEGIEV